MNAVTCYEILGLKEGASQQQIRAAYIQLAREYHPDTIPPEMRGRQIARDAEETFKQIGEAYRILSDPDLRRKYDDQLRAMRAQANQNATPPRRASGTAAGPTSRGNTTSSTNTPHPGSRAHTTSASGGAPRPGPTRTSSQPLTIECVMERVWTVWMLACLSGGSILGGWDLAHQINGATEPFDTILWFGKSALTICWPTEIPFINLTICLVLLLTVIPIMVAAVVLQFIFMIVAIVVLAILAIMAWGIGL